MHGFMNVIKVFYDYIKRHMVLEQLIDYTTGRLINGCNVAKFMVCGSTSRIFYLCAQSHDMSTCSLVLDEPAFLRHNVNENKLWPPECQIYSATFSGLHAVWHCKFLVLITILNEGTLFWIIFHNKITPKDNKF